MLIKIKDKYYYMGIFFILVILSNLIVSSTNFYIKIKIIKLVAKRIPAFLRIGPHPKDFYSAVFGSLLGNSYVEKRLNGNGTRINFQLEANHKEYLIFLHSLISKIGYTSSTLPKIHKRLSKGGKIRLVIRFNTYTYTSLN
jgi:hypothetical protein